MPPRYIVSDPAKADIGDILAVSEADFGLRARQRYERLMVAAFEYVADAPTGPLTRDRSDLGRGVRSFHLRHGGRRAGSDRVSHPVHIVYYRIVDNDVVLVGRVLHDRSDPALHMR